MSDSCSTHFRSCVQCNFDNLTRLYTGFSDKIDSLKHLTRRVLNTALLSIKILRLTYPTITSTYLELR
uniref:Uncharacterized protein n=1 Tax=Physcomitrium patens TaxID=3218 RepID=A0A2K1JWB0_PHYPA|nr:hypothetical protein PHYPA_015581 [Physcomitrium patens]